MGSGFEIQILRMSGKQSVLHTENILSVTGFSSSLVEQYCLLTCRVLKIGLHVLTNHNDNNDNNVHV